MWAIHGASNYQSCAVRDDGGGGMQEDKRAGKETQMVSLSNERPLETSELGPMRVIRYEEHC